MSWARFRLYPQLAIDESYDDNVYATASDTIDSRINMLAGNVSFWSNSSHFQTSLYGAMNCRSYSECAVEDQIDWEAGGSVAYDVTRRVAVSVRGDRRVNHQPRGDSSCPSATVEPPSFEESGAALEISHDFASGQLNFSGDYQSIDFDDAKLAGDATLNQDFRDRGTWTFEIQGSAAVGQFTALFVRAVDTERDYHLDQPVVDLSRDATSDSLLGSTTFDITNLMRGNVAISVLELDNYDPNQSDSKSVVFSSQVECYVTKLMTATMDAQRHSQVTDIAGSSSYIGTSVSPSLDYEIRRNFSSPQRSLILGRSMRTLTEQTRSSWGK